MKQLRIEKDGDKYMGGTHVIMRDNIEDMLRVNVQEKTGSSLL